ncbi:DUF4811 domain-containing protein [Lactobacillus sp. S2-2]|uniref:DUF4811 domain-containing protein n=1 Tax=Lactobacillus sp. S2-2 TaxID=2692917 RepID=UPI001F22A7C7|nr:DUF4811 domain-containing protein [Lactobacillus sp. S2-2]MCF6515194.1 DUF4811 domain-containing protein [Lactobacillus sp. S2-2]
MIFILLIIFLIGFFLSWNLIDNDIVRNVLSAILVVLIVGSVTLMTMNFHDHFGMKKETTTKTEKIASVNPKMNMIIYQQIGTSNDQAVVYKKDAKQKKNTVAKPIDTKNVIKENQKETNLEVKTTNWVYKNKFYDSLFGLAKKKEFIHKTNTFNLNKDFVSLSSKQVKELPKLMKQQQAQAKQNKAQMQTQAKTYIQTKVKADMMKDPSISVKQQKGLAQKYQKEFEAQAQAQAMKSVIAQLKKIK